MTENIEAFADSPGALLATVLDQSHDCIKLLTIDGVIQYVNRQGALAMEIASPTDLVGQTYVSRWPDAVRPQIEEALSSARNGLLGRFTGSRPQPNGLPSWWDVTVSPVISATGNVTHFVTIARDMTAEVTERERVAAISLEMRHRLKNALTVAGGIVMLGARGRPEVAAFAQEVVGRFNDLAAVQSLILDPQADMRLPQIVRTLGSAYGDGSAIEFGDLPEVQLSDQGMQALALCYGELATNSLKYGALRNGSRICVNGRMIDERLEISWVEETEFGTARAGGQGLGLIERIIKTAGGSFRRQLAGSEMQVVVTLPVS